MYQRLAAIESSAEADMLRDEMVDRFGPLEPEGLNLIETIRLRSLFRNYGVEKAEARNQALVLSFSSQAPISADKILKLVKAKPEVFRFGKNHVLSWSVDEKILSDVGRLYGMVEELLVEVGLVGRG